MAGHLTTKVANLVFKMFDLYHKFVQHVSDINNYYWRQLAFFHRT